MYPDLQSKKQQTLHRLSDTVLIIMWQELQCESMQTNKISSERRFCMYNLQDTSVYGKAASIMMVPPPHVSLNTDLPEC